LGSATSKRLKNTGLEGERERKREEERYIG
jgi:hypothetical protein